MRGKQDITDFYPMQIDFHSSSPLNSSSSCLCYCCLWGFARVFLTSSSGNPLASNILARRSMHLWLLAAVVIDSEGSVTHAPHHSCQHSGMVVGMVWDVPIRMGRFPVYCSDSLSSLCVTRTSRNASCPSFSSSMVNCMLGDSAG